MKQTEKRQLFRKQVCMALAILLAVTVAMPQSVQAAISAPSSVTTYFSGHESGLMIRVDGLGKNQQVKKSSVKSSNAKVASLDFVSREYSGSHTSSFIGEKDTKSEDYWSYISVDIHKAGTATISYQVGGKTYKTKITVKAYENPISSVTMAGVNGGKNFASLANKSSYVSQVPFSGKVKNAVVKVKPKNGWRVTRISVDDGQGTGDELSVENYGSKGVSNASLRVPAFSGGIIDITCTDKDGHSQTITYSTGY